MSKFACKWCQDTKLYTPLVGPPEMCRECSPASGTIEFTVKSDKALSGITAAIAGVSLQAPEFLTVPGPNGGTYSLPIEEMHWPHHDPYNMVRSIDMMSPAALAIDFRTLSDACHDRLWDVTKPRFYPKNSQERLRVEQGGWHFNCVVISNLGASPVGIKRGLMVVAQTHLTIELDNLSGNTLGWGMPGALRLIYTPNALGEFDVSLKDWPQHEALVADLAACWNWDAPFGEINIV